MRVLFFFFIFFASIFAHEAFASVNSVIVKGNARVDAQTVLFYANIDLSADWNAKAMAALMKRLYATNLFSNVRVNIDKVNNLVITVKENPVLISLKFKGNRVFDDKALYEAFPDLREMRIFSETKIQANIAKLVEMYNKAGKWGVKITYEIEKLSPDRVSCVISIYEGPTARVRNIVIFGNEAFSYSDLTNAMYSKKFTIFGFLSSSGNYSSENIIADRIMLKRFYASHGYIDFDVVSEVAEISDDYTSVSLFLTVYEGQRYKFGSTKFEFEKGALSNSVKRELERILTFKEGDIFDSSMVAKAIEEAGKVLNNRGYPFSFIDYDQKEREKFVDTVYKVAMGGKVYIDSISISGNTTTMDYVIMRKLTVRSGDPYSAIKVEQSKKAIYSLGFFDKVDVQMRRVSPGFVALDFVVQEKNTGVFQIGGGYSSASGFIANVNISQKNFLGTGQELSFSLEKSLNKFYTSFSASQHHIFGSDVSFGGGVFYLDDSPRDLSFERNEKGVTSGFSRYITSNLSASVTYFYKQSYIKSSMPDPSIFIREQEGSFVESGLGYRLSYGEVDNNIHPVDGYGISLAQDISGIGGNVRYLKSIFGVAYYKPILKPFLDDVNFKIKSRVGYIFDYTGSELRIGQRFFLGGEEIRGFENYGIGPRTRTRLEPLGGKFVFSGTFQVDFPMPFVKDFGLFGSFFTDFGTLFGLDYKDPNFYEDVYNDKSLRISVGFGFAWRSPMGPMRVDFGFPVKKEPYDITSIVKFSMDY